MAVAGYPLTLAHEFYGGWDGVLGILLGASVLATYLHTHSAAACDVWLFSVRLLVMPGLGSRGCCCGVRAGRSTGQRERLPAQRSRIEGLGPPQGGRT